MNKEVTLFAAPYATLNEKHVELFKQAGYQRVFLTFPQTEPICIFVAEPAWSQRIDQLNIM